MTLRDVFQLPVMKPGSVATHRELDEDREVTSVSVQEIPVDKFIRPGELVLSTGMDVGKHAGRLARFIREVAQSGASALALAVGPHTPRIPPSAIEAANRARLPLIRLPWEVRFSDISESILRRLIQEQAKTRTRDDFVWALATQSAGEDTLSSQARQLGFDARAPHVAVVGKVSAAHARVAEEVCHKIAAQHNLRWLGAVVGDSILGYLQAPAAAAKINAICKAVQGAVRDRCVIAWGVGRTCHDFAGFPKSYEDARMACEIGQRVRGAEAITHVSDILADRVLLNLRHDADVAMLLERYINPLKASKRTPLLFTLEVFFECDCNASAAARKLSLSRQSLLYRLDKIAALLKLDLRSTEERFALDLALRLNRFSDTMSKEIGG